MKVLFLFVGLFTGLFLYNCTKEITDTGSCPTYEGEVPGSIAVGTYSNIRHDSRLEYGISEFTLSENKAFISFSEKSKTEDKFTAEFEIVSKQMLVRPVYSR